MMSSLTGVCTNRGWALMPGYDYGLSFQFLTLNSLALVSNTLQVERIPGLLVTCSCPLEMRLKDPALTVLPDIKTKHHNQFQ